MKTYARIDGGIVAEVISPVFYEDDVVLPGTPAAPPSENAPEGQPAGEPVLLHKKGDEVPIEARYTAEFVAALVLVPGGQNVSPGDTYDGSSFGPPPLPPVAPPPTATEVLAQRDSLLSIAALRIAPLQDAVDLGDATAAEEVALKAWKQYRVALNRIELQAGFPTALEWPKSPA